MRKYQRQWRLEDIREFNNDTQEDLATLLNINTTTYRRKEKGVAEQLESKSYLVDVAVKAVEQIYKNYDGPTKFELAKKEAVKLLKNNGLEVSSVELDNFIESSVKAMKDGFVGVIDISESLPAPDIETEVKDGDVKPQV